MAGSQAEGDQEKGPGVNETHKRKRKPQTDSASEKGDQWEGEKWVLLVFQGLDSLLLALAESSACSVESHNMQNGTKSE